MPMRTLIALFVLLILIFTALSAVCQDKPPSLDSTLGYMQNALCGGKPSAF